MRRLILASRREGRDDAGAALILALIFVTGVGLVVGSLLTYASTGIASAKQTLNAQQAAYDSEGALQSAINDVRQSDYFNNTVSGQQCFNSNTSMTKNYPTSAGGSITVACAPDPTTGAAGGLVPVNNTNKPSLALLTMGTSGGETGLLKTANSALRIHGSVYSNSTVATSGGSACPATPQPPTSNCNEIYVEGASLTAEGTCTGAIYTSTPGGRSCSTGTHVAAGDDPGTTYPTAYAQPSTGMTPRTLPTCTSGVALVTFSPGYYDDAVGLSNLMDGHNPCGGKTFWFQPGVYYFDFHNSDMPGSGSPVVPNGPNVWTINDSSAFIIGGTKQGWTTQATSIPGACVSPLTSTSSTGVEFVFGGDSQLYVQNGNVELCGTWYTDTPPITVYGAKTTVGTATSASLVPSAATGNTGTANFTNLSPVSTLASNSDGNAGPVASGVAGNKTAILAVTQFSGLSSPVSTRAVLDSAVLTVRHGESGANAGTALSVTLTPGRSGAATITKTLAPTVGSSTVTYKQESFDVTSALSAEMYAYGLPSASVPFTASVKLTTDGASPQSVTEQVDYLQLALTWKPIAVRAESGCVTTVAGCALIGTKTVPGVNMYLQGTAYLPLAMVDVTLNNVSGQVFRSGLVARAAKLRITASSTYAGPVIELPDNTLAPTPLQVYFTAWQCPTSLTCSSPPPASPWKAVGRAKATYTDLGFTPVPGDRQVTVTAWNLAR